VYRPQCNLRFLSTTVLQSSVATRVNYGRIFNDFFIANLLLSVTVKEFWRSVWIWQSYGKKIKWHLFFWRRCRSLVECQVTLRSLTYARETGSRNRLHRPRRQISGASFSCRCTTSNVTDCLRERRFLEPVSRACVRGFSLAYSITCT